MERAMHTALGHGTGYYKYQLSLRSEPSAHPTLTQRLAWLLRRWADRLDGGWSLSFNYYTEPELSRARLANCLNCGLDKTGELVKSELESTITDDFMRRQHPSLYPSTHATGGNHDPAH